MKEPTLAIKPIWLTNHDEEDLQIKYFDKPDIEILK